ncbi:MAG: orotate phosphoribosyltransferase [Nitrospira sp.]
MTTLQHQLVRAFHETQSFKWDPSNGFKLASGLMSPYYIDCRSLMAHPHARWLVAQMGYQLLQPLTFECLGGLEIGAIAIATCLSDYALTAQPPRAWRTFVVRKQAKDHGLGKLLEGAAQRGDRAVIVDDVLTSGGSLLKAIAAARAEGLTVAQAFVIVDREEQNGRQRVEQEGVTVLSLLRIHDLTADLVAPPPSR